MLFIKYIVKKSPVHLEQAWVRFGLGLCIVFGHILQAQTTKPPLERLVNIQVSNMPADEFLKLLGKEAQINFSYNPSILTSDKKIQVNLKNKSVRYILNAVFEGKIQYKTKGNYLILSKAPVPKSPEVNKPKFFKVSGYVLDNYTTAGLSNASVYDSQSFYSAVTNRDGYFTINLPYDKPNIVLKIQKQGYKDSTLTIVEKGYQNVEIFLLNDKPVELTFDVPRDSTQNLDTTKITTVLIEDVDSSMVSEPKKENLWLVINSKIKAHLQNIPDTLFRTAQISVLPTLSTNKLISGNVVNDYSLNVLGGYNYGVKKLEIGGLFNINRGDVGKCQVAGLTNLVGGKVTGFQAAGLVNLVRDTVKGSQAAGLINFNFRHTEGAQFAGLANHAKTLYGCQFAGLYNATFKTLGGQFAGLFNTSLHVEGLQVAGLFNTAWDVKGSQISGLFNFARKVTGMQIGFLNISDSCKGVPIGFLSLVRSGYHKIEISTDEVLRYNAAFRTGSSKFYNILGVGSSLASGNKFAWSYSYGIGTSIKLHKKLNLDVDLQSSQLNADKHANYLSLNNRLNLGVDWQLAKKFSIAFGPSFNTYVVDNRLYTENSFYQNVGSSYPTHKFTSSSNIDVRSWLSWKVAVRFL